MASGAENENELIIRRKCDGTLDIVLVGEMHSFPTCFLVCILHTHSNGLLPQCQTLQHRGKVGSAV